MRLTLDRTAITSSAELAASVPALIGFNPEASLVIVFADEARVIVTMRMDLAQAWADMTASALVAAQHVGARRAYIVVYSDVEGDLPCRAEVEAVAGALEANHVAVHDLLAVDGDRWWDYRVASMGSSGDGTDVDPSLAQICAGALAARRSDVADRYDRQSWRSPSMQAVEEVTIGLSHDPRERAEFAWEALQKLSSLSLRDGLEGDRQRALVQISCLDVRCRDYLLGRILETQNPDELVKAFVETTLRCHDETLPRMAGAAAALLAATEPSSVPAQCLIELAGEDSLAHLVEASIRMATPPVVYAQLLRDSLPQTLAALATEGGME